MPMVKDGDMDRPACAPEIKEPVKEITVQERVQALPVENWRMDPNRDPGPGFEWEAESDYFPAHWARVA